MPLVRTPYRITLGGGGSDLPHLDRGLCVTLTIDKYVHTLVRPSWEGIICHHAHGMERVTDPRLLDHRLLRVIMTELDVRQMEFAAVADLPSGTGLGSSSAFTVGAINAVWQQQNIRRLPSAIADRACRIEVDYLKDPIGYQDQYACAIGGLLMLEFDHGRVSYRRLKQQGWLYTHLRLFYTGVRRDSASQMGHSPDVLTLIDQAESSLKALHDGDYQSFATGLTSQWDAKYQAAPSDFHTQVDGWLEQAFDLGADGGKLLGAGNGGFLLIAADQTVDLTSLGLREVPIQPTFIGTEALC